MLPNLTVLLRTTNSLVLGIRYACLVLLLVSAQSTMAAPKAKLLPFWNKSDAFNKTIIDHSAWGTFLRTYAKKHPSDINRVDYAAVSRADIDALNAYIQSLEKINIRSYNRNEQFAFWVNLYNAATVRVVLQHYPIKSITKVSFGIFDFGPWDEPLLQVEQQPLSLNNIEHGILRPIWRDKRIHYVVNCASLGCPNLLLQPFSSQEIDAQLTRAAQQYIDHQRGLALEGNTLHLSKIYDWYASDFGSNELDIAKSLITIQTRNISKEDKEALKPYQNWFDLPDNKRKTRYHYDWQLNQP